MNNNVQELKNELENIKKELENINSYKESLLAIEKKINETTNLVNSKINELDSILEKVDVIDFTKNVNLSVNLKDLNSDKNKKALDSYLEYLNTNPEFKQENAEIVFGHYIQDLINNDEFRKNMNEDKK